MKIEFFKISDLDFTKKKFEHKFFKNFKNNPQNYCFPLVVNTKMVIRWTFDNHYFILYSTASISKSLGLIQPPPSLFMVKFHRTCICPSRVCQKIHGIRSFSMYVLLSFPTSGAINMIKCYNGTWGLMNVWKDRQKWCLK